MKACPFCAEQIQDAAIKCRYCGEMVGDPPGGANPISAPTSERISSRPALGATGTAVGMEPVTLRATPRALLGRHLPGIVLMVLGLAGLLYIEVAAFPLSWAWLFFGGLVIWYVLALLLALLRIRNTQYTITPSKIEGTSYLFRFLGVWNSAVSMAQVKTLRGYSNSKLDIWFFHCGGIVLTVAGDVTDFNLRNLSLADRARAKLLVEQHAFGSRAA